MNNENYITIQGWMRNEFDLKGNELLVYALIYGFSQDGESKYTGSVGYIADWIGSSRQTVHNVLRSLTDKGLIYKDEQVLNGVKFCQYTTVVKGQLLQGVKKFDRGVSKNLTRGCQKILHNNIADNDNIKNINKIPPSLEEVRSYCEQRNNGIDAEAFIDYYAQQGWKLANGNPMKDWQASVRTWEKRNKAKPPQKYAQPEPPKYKQFEPEPEIDTCGMPDEMRTKYEGYINGL